MTEVTAKRDGNLCCIEAEGHATGSEQVCAAVSGIMYALAAYAINCKNCEILRLELEPGHAVVCARGGKIVPAYRMAALGLGQIAAQYPEYIRYSESQQA